MMPKQQWDIFCRIVDNYGDIGVCWRLAQQLAAEHHLAIRLWVDDLKVAQQMIPQLGLDKAKQNINGIAICAWQAETHFSQVADVVVEAFACGLPQHYQQQMSADTIWINLEYLSAESWVEDFHGRYAQHGKLKRYAYFPGFRQATGGLIREQYMPVQTQHMHDDARLQVSLFCYDNAPVLDLLSTLSQYSRETVLHTFDLPVVQQYASFFNQTTLTVGQTYRKNNLTLRLSPFLPQTAYDDLLAQCDLNFVRGEDSWVRAIWAGKPMIWQPYVQTENTHLDKLQAFIDDFYVDCDARKSMQLMSQAWSTGTLNHQHWQQCMQDLPILLSYAHQQRAQLMQQDDLAMRLVAFCNRV